MSEEVIRELHNRSSDTENEANLAEQQLHNLAVLYYEAIANISSIHDKILLNLQMAKEEIRMNFMKHSMPGRNISTHHLDLSPSSLGLNFNASDISNSSTSTPANMEMLRASYNTALDSLSSALSKFSQENN